MTTPPEPPPPAPKNDDAGPLDKRVGAIEAEQTRQGTVLDRIVGMLGGEGDSNVTTGTPPPADGADMAEQMRQAVRDVQAEADAELGKQQRLGGKRPEPETTPREVTLKGKDKLQRFIFGGDPK